VKKTITLPPPSELERLKISPEVAHYLLSRGYRLTKLTCPPRWKTPEPRTLRGAVFDGDCVDRVVKALRNLVHTQGQWAGKPLEPDIWQVAYVLAPVYGWVHRNSSGNMSRIVRTVYVDIPRKNGKTTLAGGQAIYLTCADGEAGAQVYAVAAAKDQARFCFSPIKALAEKSPNLAPYVKSLADRVVHPASGSYFAVVASVADLIHGANVHAAVIDELHIHKTRDVVDAVETGTGAREQPLIVIITTADEGKPNTIYAEKRLYCEQLARGVFEDHTFYGVVFAADRDDDPFAESSWRKANPGYGVSPTREFLVAEAQKAKQSPANLARFLRLHLGIRTKQTTRFVRLEDWDACTDLVDERDLYGRECHGGLDLSSVSDVTALCWMFPDRARDRCEAIWRFFLPEAALSDLSRRTAGQADVWVDEGWLTLTPGNVLDNDAVLYQVAEDAERFKILTLGFDRWNANDVTRRIGDEGLLCVALGQGFASANAPLKELLRLVLDRRFAHGGNPVMRWMIDNLAVTMDAAGNVKPDKASAADKIDGVSAAVMALSECLTADAALPPPAAATPPTVAPGDLFRPKSRLRL
jgi:phage terminase large subunit-like protein